MRYIFERFNKDLTTKITALLLGILLWFIVLNINDPYIEKKFYVELEVKNEYNLAQKNLYLVNKNYRKTVEISVRGRENATNNISPSDFDVVLDFSKIKSVYDSSIKLDGPYYTKNDKQVTLIGMSPEEIPVELENIARQDFVIEVELKGIPKKSYKVLKVSTEPEYITIQDRESLITTIKGVKALVDINNIDRDKKIIRQTCFAYDENGEEISSLGNQFTIDVFLEVGKEIGIVPIISGEPAEEHIFTGFHASEETAIIKGPIEILENLNELNTEQIKIDGLNENRGYTTSIKLPENVKLYNMENEIVVDIVIEKLQEKEFVINSRDIEIENIDYMDTLEYEILTEESKLLIKGRSIYLNSVSISSLTPHVDVKDLKEGTHILKLITAPLPELEIIEIPNIEIRIFKTETQETSTPVSNTEEDDEPKDGEVDENMQEEEL